MKKRVHTRGHKLVAFGKKNWAGLALVGLVMVAPALAQAASAGSGGLPWEAPLDMFVKSINGPVAYGISLLGVAGVAWGFLFGGELNQFLRGGVILVAAISLLVGGASIMSGMFNKSAVIIAAAAPLYGA